MLGQSEYSDELWMLMEKALPAMINLKHLYINPAADCCPADDDWVSSYNLMETFTFQLKTFAWKNYFDPQNGVPEFLATQHNLVHLESGEYPGQPNLTWLRNGVCPRLISVSCGFNSFSHVAQTRNIIAWRWSFSTKSVELAAQASSVLDRLTYLSISDYPSLRNVIGPVNLNIILLELTLEAWQINVSSIDMNYDRCHSILSCRQFPLLRTCRAFGFLF